MIALLLGAIVMALICPLWFPWVLRPTLAHFNIQTESYDRQGYGALELRNVKFDQDGVSFSAETVKILQPATWLWSRYLSPLSENHVAVHAWQLDLKPTTASTTSSNSVPTSTATILSQIEEILPLVQPWVPVAELTEGTITFDSERIDLPTASWRKGLLNADVRRDEQQLQLEALLGGSFQLQTQLAPFDLGVSTELIRSGSDWSTKSTIHWRTNEATLVTYFDPGDPLPSHATLSAPPWTLPASWLGFEGYHDPITSISAVWTNGELNLQLEAQLEPSGTNNFPPLDLKARASATQESIEISQFNVTAPGTTLLLKSPITIGTTTLERPKEALFQIKVDLGQLPFANLSGVVEGEAILVPQTNSPIPHTTVQLSGKDLLLFEQAISQVALSSDLKWPNLTLSTLDLVLTNEASVKLSGGMNLESLVITNGEWSVDGSLPALPEGYIANQAKGSGSVQGPLTSPRHSGHLKIGEFHALNLQTTTIDLHWQGFGLTNFITKASVEAGSSQLQTDLRIERSTSEGSDIGLTFDKLSLLRGAKPTLELDRPTRITIGGIANTNGIPNIELAGLLLKGSDGELQADGRISWPNTATTDLRIAALSPSILNDFLTTPLPGLTVNRATFNGGWTNGPVAGNLSFEVATKGLLNNSIKIQSEIVANDATVQITQASVGTSTGPVMNLNGEIPLRIDFTNPENLLSLRERSPIRIDASTESNPTFWDAIAQPGKFKLIDPTLDLHLTGTPLAPKGFLEAKANQLKILSTNATVIPELEQLQARAEVDESSIIIRSFDLTVEGQPITLNARLPLEKGYWDSLLESGALPDWTLATIKLQVPATPLAPFAAFLPDIITTNGNFAADLSLLPGLKLNGVINLTNAATRPIATLGPVRDVEAHIQFDGSSAMIEGFTGSIGGQPIMLTGSVDASDLTKPGFDLHLKGERIPFIRQAGLLIRSDLNLRARTNPQTGTNALPPVSITGELTPRDSLFLQDLKSLIPGSLAQTARRPPYFQVPMAPYSEWELDVRVKGDRFLRVRTPLFRGELSMDMNLQGPLKEPVSLGEVRIETGSLLFPFGNLHIDQGSITLTSENPYDPAVLVNASARTFGYSVRVEAGGNASDPILTFNSTPPLTSEEILLMLTAGELPQREVVFSGKQKASRLATLLGKDLLARISGREDKAERLIIRSGEHVSEGGSLTYHLEYKLTDIWSVVGESDRFNALNAGIKWRIYSK